MRDSVGGSVCRPSERGSGSVPSRSRDTHYGRTTECLAVLVERRPVHRRSQIRHVQVGARRRGRGSLDTDENLAGAERVPVGAARRRV